ncbi:glutamate synthase, partial [Lysobacter sp. 2RAB21]
MANLPAGAYRAMVTPPATGARTMSFKTSLSTDLILPLSLDAELQAITVPRPGQNARLTFQAQAGQTRAFNVSAQSTQPENGKVYYTVYKPDGSVLHQADTRDDLTLNLPGLPASGTYTIFMDPGQGEAASMQAKLVSGQVGGPDPG